MKIALFGVTGNVGKDLVKEALANGYEVKALVRSPEKLGDLVNKIEVIKGDYFDRRLILKTIDGVDAVVSTIGPPVGRKHSFSAHDYRKSMEYIVEGMEKAGIKRFVNVSGAAISLEGESICFTRRFLRGVLRLIAPLSLPAKQMEMSILSKSKLDWTSFRPTFIVDDIQGKFQFSENSLVGMKVNTQQLTHQMIQSLSSSEWIKKAPIVGTK